MALAAMKKNVFCDLCVSDQITVKNLHTLSKLGFKVVAINKTVDEASFETKKKNKHNDSKENSDFIPAIFEIPKDTNLDLIILNRLTIQMGEVSLWNKLNQSENVKKYDILAVIPTSAAMFSHACTSIDLDIISFSPEIQTNCKINRKLYKQAVEKGIFFEILYAPGLRDSTCRRNIIQRAHLYHTLGKSANILISSGGQTDYQFRSPYDIINLGLILGLKEHLSKKSITENARKVLLKADNRKRGKAAVFFSRKNKLNPDLNVHDVANKKVKIDEDVS